MISGPTVDLLLSGHIAISLVAIVAGLVALVALAAGRWMPRLQAGFLVTTALTSVTGFLFPFGGVTPAFVFGILSIVALALAGLAWARRLASRSARITYAAAGAFALYLNLVVLVVQSFQKLSPLQRLAPTQSEAPFLAAQAAVLAIAVLLGVLASRRTGWDGPVPA